MGIILDPNYLAAQRALARKEIAQHNKLPDNYFWNSLAARRSLNPERFDYYHPYIAPWFSLPGECEVPPPPYLPVCLPPPPCVPHCEVPPSCIIPPHVVPEPSSFALGATAIGLFVFYKFIKGK